jgi:putative SOS response-associated peptidase YedK
MPAADYNVAPTTHQPIIRQSRETGDRELARWGLVPFFTKDLEEMRASNLGLSRAFKSIWQPSTQLEAPGILHVENTR